MKYYYFIVCFLFFTPSYADIYTYKDSQGKLYFTDNKMDDSYRLLSVFRPHLTQQSSKDFNFNTYQRNKEIFLPLINAAAKQYQIDPHLLHAIIDTESAFNPRAVSRVGATGLMQLMPKTAKGLGVNDRFNPEQNIQGGTRYFSQLLSRFDGQKKTCPCRL
ncbi:MAG: transglycosylase SLT domain-containing protein [Ghiorsea sp.]|nr:transglycosylase SLT domain-containing protein [Ghiorsea sp.]